MKGAPRIPRQVVVRGDRGGLVCWLARIVLAGIFLAIMFWIATANAHGSASWIMEGAYRSCCGIRDCRILGNDEYVEVQGGAFIIPLNIFVPEAAIKPAPNHHWWVCTNVDAGKPTEFKCLFRPDPGV